MTPELAGQWRAALPSSWWPVVLTGAWVTAFAVSVVTDTVPCSPADPSVCGPDTGFAVFLVPLLATPLLLWLRPLLGAAAGVVFALGDVALDDHLPANVTFGLVGVGCGLYLWRILRSRRRQRDLTRGTRAAQVSTAAEPGGWDVLRVGLAGVLALAALGLGGWYARSVAVEEARVARSVVLEGEVVAVDDVDYLAHVELGHSGRTVAVPVIEPGDYAEGMSVPVLLDPAEPDRSTLVAEPPDHTGWLSGAIAAAAAAAVLLAAETWRRRAVRRLWTAPAPRTEVVLAPDPDGSGHAILLPVDGTGPDGPGGPGGRHAQRPLALVPVAFAVPRVSDAAAGADGWAEPAWDELEEPEPDEPDPDEPDPETILRLEAETVDLYGRVWRDEAHWTELLDEDEAAELTAPAEQGAVAVGGLYDGGYVLLLTDDAVLVPSGPVCTGGASWGQRGRAAGKAALDAVRRPFTADTAAAGTGFPPGTGEGAGAPDPEDGPPGRAVAPGPVGGAVVVGTTPQRRALGAALVVAGLLGGPAWVRWGAAGDWFHAVSGALAAGSVLLAGVRRALTEVRADDAGLTVVTGTWRHRVPWPRFHGVRRDGTTLWLAWEPFTEVEVPAVAGGPHAGRRAEELAAALAGHARAARLRVGEVGPVRREPGPAVALLVLLVAGVAAAWLV